MAVDGILLHLLLLLVTSTLTFNCVPGVNATVGRQTHPAKDSKTWFGISMELPLSEPNVTHETIDNYMFYGSHTIDGL